MGRKNAASLRGAGKTLRHFMGPEKTRRYKRTAINCSQNGCLVQLSQSLARVKSAR